MQNRKTRPSWICLKVSFAFLFQTHLDADTLAAIVSLSPETKHLGDASKRRHSPAGLAKQASQLTMYDLKSYYTQAKNAVLNVSEMEAKVREATNDDPWSAACLEIRERQADGQGRVVHSDAADRGRVSSQMLNRFNADFQYSQLVSWA